MVHHENKNTIKILKIKQTIVFFCHTFPAETGSSRKTADFCWNNYLKLKQ